MFPTGSTKCHNGRSAGNGWENHVYMKLDHPMSIMSTSDCREEAFDFIMYYSSLAELLTVTESENDYGKNGNTNDNSLGLRSCSLCTVE